MVDVWRRWDSEVKRCGDPASVAGLLTDAELLAMLSSDEDPHRRMEKRFLREEAFRRMQAADQRPPPSRQAEPSPDLLDPAAFSSVPTRGGHVDRF